MQSRFKAYAWDDALGAEKPSLGKGEELFRYKEESNCLVRQCLGSARPYKMAMWPNSPVIGTFRGPTDDPFHHPDALIIERPFRCTIFCLWRSIFRVRHNTVSAWLIVVNRYQLTPVFILRRCSSRGYHLRTLAHYFRPLSLSAYPMPTCTHRAHENAFN